MSDPISEMLTSIRNAQAVGKKTVTVGFSKMKYALAEILKKEGFLHAIHQTGRTVSDKKIEIELLYDEKNNPAISAIKRISKSSQRIYTKSSRIRRIRQGFGIAILSTSKGLMTNKEARKQKLGGEIICEVY